MQPLHAQGATGAGAQHQLPHLPPSTRPGAAGGSRGGGRVTGGQQEGGAAPASPAPVPSVQPWRCIDSSHNNATCSDCVAPPVDGEEGMQCPVLVGLFPLGGGACGTSTRSAAPECPSARLMSRVCAFTTSRLVRAGWRPGKEGASRTRDLPLPWGHGHHNGRHAAAAARTRCLPLPPDHALTPHHGTLFLLCVSEWGKEATSAPRTLPRVA
jgi:hypothetical protein